MENDDLYLGALPPVEVKATNCHTVNVNVHVTIEPMQQETLRKLAEVIEAKIMARILETGT